MIRKLITLMSLIVLVGWQVTTADGPPTYATTDGVALTDMNSAVPTGSESGANWAPALRYVKYKLLEFGSQEHNLDGTHKTNYLTSVMIQDGAVTEAKLSGGVQTKLNAVGGTNTTSTLLITNALTYVTSIEGTILTPVTSTDLLLASATLSSNTYRKALLTAEIVLENNTTGTKNYTVKLKSGGLSGTTLANLGPFKVGANSSLPFSPSTIITAGNTSDLLLCVVGSGDKGVIHVNNLRIWGIP